MIDKFKLRNSLCRLCLRQASDSSSNKANSLLFSFSVRVWSHKRRWYSYAVPSNSPIWQTVLASLYGASADFGAIIYFFFNSTLQNSSQELQYYNRKHLFSERHIHRASERNQRHQRKKKSNLTRSCEGKRWQPLTPSHSHAVFEGRSAARALL